MRTSRKFERDDESHVPNLDKMSESELMDFWMKYQNRQKRADVLALVGRRKNYTTIAGDLGAYAVNKATAKACLRRGDELAAEIYEKICDNIYSYLPKDLRFKR